MNTMTNFNLREQIENWKRDNPFWENEELGVDALAKLDTIHKWFIEEFKEKLNKHYYKSNTCQLTDIKKIEVMFDRLSGFPKEVSGEGE